MTKYGASNVPAVTSLRLKAARRAIVESAMVCLSREWKDIYPSGCFVWDIPAAGNNGLVLSVTAYSYAQEDESCNLVVSQSPADLVADFILGWWEIPAPTLFDTEEQVVTGADNFCRALMNKITVASRAAERA